MSKDDYCRQEGWNPFHIPASAKSEILKYIKHWGAAGRTWSCFPTPSCTLNGSSLPNVSSFLRKAFHKLCLGKQLFFSLAFTVPWVSLEKLLCKITRETGIAKVHQTTTHRAYSCISRCKQYQVLKQEETLQLACITVHSQTHFFSPLKTHTWL